MMMQPPKMLVAFGTQNIHSGQTLVRAYGRIAPIKLCLKVNWD